MLDEWSHRFSHENNLTHHRTVRRNAHAVGSILVYKSGHAAGKWFWFGHWRGWPLMFPLKNRGGGGTLAQSLNDIRLNFYQARESWPPCIRWCISIEEWNEIRDKSPTPLPAKE
jgi:hypothetical protein